jgi:hypothetical protein
VAVRVSVHQPSPERTLATWLDSAPDLSCANSTQGHWVDAEHQPTDLAVGGSNPSRRATITAAQRPYRGTAAYRWTVGVRPNCDHVGGHSRWGCDHLPPQTAICPVPGYRLRAAGAMPSRCVGRRGRGMSLERGDGCVGIQVGAAMRAESLAGWSGASPRSRCRGRTLFCWGPVRSLAGAKDVFEGWAARSCPSFVSTFSPGPRRSLDSS